MTRPRAQAIGRLRMRRPPAAVIWGANRGANGRRHRAMLSHEQPESMQLDAMSGDMQRCPATL